MESSSNWDEFRITKGGLLALHKIAGWKLQLADEVRERKNIADSDEGVE